MSADPIPTGDVATRLVDSHRQFLAFLDDRVLAEDILQDAFVEGIEKAPGLRDDEAAVAWFYRLLATRCRTCAEHGCVECTCKR